LPPALYAPACIRLTSACVCGADDLEARFKDEVPVPVWTRNQTCGFLSMAGAVEEFAHARQKYDRGCYGGCNTTLDDWRPRARKRWHGRYIHRHRGANGARGTRNEKQRLDSAARRSNES
jgi:hypothetical protein